MDASKAGGGGAGRLADVERTLRRVIVFLALASLVCGITGYLKAHPDLGKWKAFYAACVLLFMESADEALGNASSNDWIWTARYLALAAASSVVFAVVLELCWRFRAWFLGLAWRLTRRWGLYRDFTVIYTDNPRGERLERTARHAYATRRAPDEDKIIDSPWAIIMYADERRSLDFFARNRDRLPPGRTYLALDEVDAFLLRERARDGDRYFRPRCFNPHDLMARAYWREHHLADLVDQARRTGSGPVRVALIGRGAPGRALFKYAYLNNLYRPDQEIHYHLWGRGQADSRFLEGLRLGDKSAPDQIHLHHEAWNDAERGLAVLPRMHRVIVALDDPLETLQELLYLNPQCGIHCHSADGTVYEDIFRYRIAGDAANGETADGLLTFGPDEALTVADIKEEKTYRMAKLINHDYCLLRGATRDMESEWDGLNGFLQGSNIARADHYWVEKRLGEDRETIRRLEHLRWRRYHYYNRWEYAPERNDTLRRHPDLAPYDELDADTRAKDDYRDEIRVLLDREEAARRQGR